MFNNVVLSRLPMKFFVVCFVVLNLCICNFQLITISYFLFVCFLISSTCIYFLFLCCFHILIFNVCAFLNINLLYRGYFFLLFYFIYHFSNFYCHKMFVWSLSDSFYLSHMNHGYLEGLPMNHPFFVVSSFC